MVFDCTTPATFVRRICFGAAFSFLNNDTRRLIMNSTLGGDGYAYRYGHENDYELEDGDPDENLHPSVRRRAQQIVHRQRIRKLWQWWLGIVGVLNVLAAGAAVLCAGFGMGFIAMLMMIAAVLLTLYLLSLALRQPPIVWN
jgi:hypothetical protein